MFTIAKKFSFCASHKLPAACLEEGHPCARLHGHNYEVELILQGLERTEAGFVIDYRKLDTFKAHVDDHFDHKHLNDIVVDTTAEGLAMHFYGVAASFFGSLIVAVRVSETGKTWAEYRP